MVRVPFCGMRQVDDFRLISSQNRGELLGGGIYLFIQRPISAVKELQRSDA
jgi:hypothetical protein